MNRRSFLALLSVPVVMGVLQSCGGSSNSSRGTTVDTVDPMNPVSLRSKLARAATVPGDAAAATNTVNRFGADLLAQLIANDPTANLVVSPASIAIALAMTSAGARGTTLTEMDAVLHVDDPASIHHSMNALSAALEATTRSESDSAGGTNSVQLSVANSLWGQTGFRFEQPFLDQLATEYDSGLNLVDYIGDSEAARTAINDWVDHETGKRIPELLVPGVLTPDSRLTLVNAIYLKAQWNAAFPDNRTVDETFTTAAGTTVTVPMMHIDERFAHASGDGWQVVDVPYVFGDLTMTLLVADDATVVLPSVDEAVAGLRTRPVLLGVPRWDIESKVALRTVLAAMGMPTAFESNADFTGMTLQAPLEISDVIHQANITVDEKGTEAAAATAVVMRETSAPLPEEPVMLTIDRPFTFALRHRATGAVVFLGRVCDPTISR